MAREIAIREGTIRLGQLLKLADLIEAGSDAKGLIADGLVYVNGDVEHQRGRQLRPGDVVRVGEDEVVVVQPMTASE